MDKDDKAARKIVAKRVERIRIKQGLTKKEMAKKMYISISTYYRLINTKSDFRRDHFFYLYKNCSVDIGELLKGLVKLYSGRAARENEGSQTKKST